MFTGNKEEADWVVFSRMLEWVKANHQKATHFDAIPFSRHEFGLLGNHQLIRVDKANGHEMFCFQISEKGELYLEAGKLLAGSGMGIRFKSASDPCICVD